MKISVAFYIVIIAFLIQNGPKWVNLKVACWVKCDWLRFLYGSWWFTTVGEIHETTNTDNWLYTVTKIDNWLASWFGNDSFSIGIRVEYKWLK